MTTVPTPHLDNKHVVFGEVIGGKGIIREIENLPTQGSDKPAKDVIIKDCGELTEEEAKAASQKAPDSTGDPYEDFPEDQNGGELEAKEVLKIATDLKEYGNKAFKSGDIPVGLGKYLKGLRYLNEKPDTEKDPETAKQLDAIRFTLHSNSALLAIKLKSFGDALRSATYALEVPNISDAEKGKALYRRALAKVGTKDEEGAQTDLEEALRVVPGDPAITKELASVKKAATERAKKEKAAYSKFFA